MLQYQISENHSGFTREELDRLLPANFLLNTLGCTFGIFSSSSKYLFDGNLIKILGSMFTLCLPYVYVMLAKSTSCENHINKVFRMEKHFNLGHGWKIPSLSSGIVHTPREKLKGLHFDQKSCLL